MVFLGFSIMLAALIIADAIMVLHNYEPIVFNWKKKESTEKVDTE